jgi:transcriptional regulator
MYVPEFNRVEDNDKIDELLERYGFATVVTQKNGDILASHLPVLLERRSDDARVLRSHMARANRQWQHFAPEREVLCVFSGPHAYISPSWYKMQHTVPTWNYAVVHVYGTASIVDDMATLREIVLDTTAKYESMMPEPWQVPLSQSEIEAMLKAVVGFSIEVTRVEGKLKLGQNRSVEDQEGMLRGLLSSRDSRSQELGKFILAQGASDGEMKENLWP